MADRTASLLIGFASVVAVLLLWEFAANHRLVNPALMPAPTTIFETLKIIVTSGDFLRPLGYTAALFGVGYTIACALGTALGLWMGCSRAAYGLFEPLVELIRPVPKSALVPALFLFLGIGKLTMMTVVVLAAVFPVLINTLQGVRGIDPVLLDMARTFGCSRSRTLAAVIVPAVLPSILTGMKVGLGLGIAIVVLAEMLAGENGVGFMILDAQRSFATRDMYVWIVILAAFGASLSLLFDRIERYLVPWRGR